MVMVTTIKPLMVVPAINSVRTYHGSNVGGSSPLPLHTLHVPEPSHGLQKLLYGSFVIIPVPSQCLHSPLPLQSSQGSLSTFHTSSGIVLPI